METLRELGIRYHRRFIFNCYVVEDGGAGTPMVVDPGIPSNVRAARDSLLELSARAVTVTATHAHVDHVSGMPELRDAPGATLYLPAMAESYARGQTPRETGLREFMRFLPVLLEEPFDPLALVELARSRSNAGFGMQRYRFPGVVHYLRAGEPAPGAPDWQVLHTPGHTDCSTSLWNERTRTLISGDAVLSFEGRAWFNPEFCDSTLADTTEQLLRSLPVEHLLPGHGQPVSGPGLMGRALSHRERPAGWSIWNCRARRRARWCDAAAVHRAG